MEHQGKRDQVQELLPSLRGLYSALKMLPATGTPLSVVEHLTYCANKIQEDMLHSTRTPPASLGDWERASRAQVGRLVADYEDRLKEKDVEIKRLLAQIKSKEEEEVAKLFPTQPQGVPPQLEDMVSGESGGADGAAGGDPGGVAPMPTLNRKRNFGGEAMEKDDDDSSYGGSAGEEEEEDDEASTVMVRQRKRGSRQSKPKTWLSQIPAAQQAMIECLAEQLFRQQIPDIGYRPTIEGCLQILFLVPSFQGAVITTLKELEDAVRALPQDVRFDVAWQVRNKVPHKRSMKKIFTYLLDDNKAPVKAVSAAWRKAAGVPADDVERQIFTQACKLGLGMGEEIFRKILGEVFVGGSLLSLDDFKTRMSQEETQQQFIRLYDATTDNPKKGVICRIFDAAGLDGSLLIRANRRNLHKTPGSVGMGFVPLPSGGKVTVRRPAVSFEGVEMMTAVERQVYDKVRSCGLNLYEAVFRKVLADKVLPVSALESLDAFTAHMRKGKTQAELLEYSMTRCSNDNQKKGAVSMLFIAAGVDASFLKSSNRKKVLPRFLAASVLSGFTERQKKEGGAIIEI